MITKHDFKSMLQQIGNTPMVHLDFGTKPLLLAKLEYLNPGGSLKDRSALFMIEVAEKKGLLKPGGTIVEASSGNQGIAIAMIGAIKGYRVVITVPDRTSKEKVDTLRAYGAEVIVCPDTETLEDPKSYHAQAERMFHETEGAYMPNQYFNAENVYAHFATTGPEIWEQTQGQVTHFFAGMGSCGTISGVGRFLKGQNPGVRIIGIDSANSILSAKTPKTYLAEGIGVDVMSETLDMSVIDEVCPVTDAECFAMTRSLSKKGILVGISSGAVMHVALQYAKRLERDHVMVVVLADSGRAYLSKMNDA